MRWWLVGIVLLGCSSSEPTRPLTKEQLGNQLFNDLRLSEPAGQACADCHDAGFAFADPEDDRVSVGVLRERFGSRNSQSAMYAAFVPPLHADPKTGRMIGGLFWDGRANTLEEQALVPLLNPLEMNNPSKQVVVAKIRKHYGRAFRDLYGKDALDDVDRAFSLVGDALAAFQRTAAFAPFSSKYDRYLAGRAQLTDSEARGLALFEDPARGNCASCHPSRPGDDGKPPLFTTFAYENVGLPKFADNPFYMLPKDLNPDGEAFIDRGLGKTTGNPQHDGMFRIPSLRNVAKTGPYGHNGYMRRLDDMVALFAGTCVEQCTLPPPEIAANALRQRTAQPMTRQDIADLVAFLVTLTDE
jgi:cytochrome c peroxidase